MKPIGSSHTRTGLGVGLPDPVVGQINYAEDIKRVFYLPKWLEVVRKPHTHTHTHTWSDWLRLDICHRGEINVINTRYS